MVLANPTEPMPTGPQNVRVGRLFPVSGGCSLIHCFFLKNLPCEGVTNNLTDVCKIDAAATLVQFFLSKLRSMFPRDFIEIVDNGF